MPAERASQNPPRSEDCREQAAHVRCSAPVGWRGAACTRRRVFGAQRGFSLLEVLIALAVLALALFALSRTAALSLTAAAHREETLLAGIVAGNVLTEIRLDGQSPAPGRREGQQRQGGREFYWRASIVDSDLPGVRRIDIAVALDPERRDRRVSLTGFAGQP